MSARIYVRSENIERPDIEFDSGETIIFERLGLRMRVYFDQSGDLRISGDQPVTISPEASNVFVVRHAVDHLVRLAALRVRTAIGQSMTADDADVRILIEAVLR